MLDDELLRGHVSDRISLLPRRNFRVLHVAEVIKGGICTHLRDLIELQRRTFGADRVTLVVPGSQADELQAPGWCDFAMGPTVRSTPARRRRRLGGWCASSHRMWCTSIQHSLAPSCGP